MAYACPVCTEPQVDAGHLADHVAFTAITGDEAHETWLDETVGDWGEIGQAELAEILVEHAEETEFPIDLDESEVGPENHAHDHGDGVGGGHERGHRGPSASRAPAAADEDVQDVLDEARDMTQRMQGEDADGPDADDTNAEGTEADGTDANDTDANDTDADGVEGADEGDADNETQ